MKNKKIETVKVNKNIYIGRSGDGDGDVAERPRPVPAPTTPPRKGNLSY